MSKFNLRGVNHKLLLVYLANAIDDLPFPSVIPFGESGVRLEFPKRSQGGFVTEEELARHLTGESGPCYTTMAS